MTQNPAAPQHVAEFVHVARSFCAIVDGHATMSAAQFLQRVQLILPRLYSSALLLPSVDADVPDCDNSSKHPLLWSSLRAQIGEWDEYREIFAPYGPPEEEPVVGSLADDISDIYAEIAGALRCWDEGNREGALWTLRTGLQFHWGEHVTGAMRALYGLSPELDLMSGDLAP